MFFQLLLGKWECKYFKATCSKVIKKFLMPKKKLYRLLLMKISESRVYGKWLSQERTISARKNIKMATTKNE